MLKYRYEYFNDILATYLKTENVAGLTKNILQNTTFNLDDDYIQVKTLSSRKHTLITRSLDERDRIRELRLVYIELYDAVMLINSRSGIALLSVTVSMVTMCVSALYYGFYILNISTDSNGSNLQIYVTSCFLISWSILYLSLFTWMIARCHETSRESEKGFYHIQRLMAHRHIKHDTASELERLSNQLKNMKIKFTACDFFVLKFPFLCTVLGEVFTYIIIILQLS